MYSYHSYQLFVLIVCWSTNATNLVTVTWTKILPVLELYGNHWEDIAVCAGLVSTATVVLLIVFLPKVSSLP